MPLIGNQAHTVARPDWDAHPGRSCANVDPEVFFPDDRGDGGRAKAICATCPVRVDCAEFAISQPNLSGIWGGTSYKERARIRRQRAKELAA